MRETVTRPSVNRRGPKSAPRIQLAVDRHGDVVDASCRTPGELVLTMVIPLEGRR